MDIYEKNISSVKHTMTSWRLILQKGRSKIAKNMKTGAKAWKSRHHGIMFHNKNNEDKFLQIHDIILEIPY